MEQEKGLVGLEEVEDADDFAGLDAVGDVEFAIDALDLGFDGIDGDDQGASDLRIRVASGEQLKDTVLLHAEGGGQERGGWDMDGNGTALLGEGQQ